MKENKNTIAYANKLKYVAKYNKENTRNYYIMLNKNYDKDLIEKLNSVKSKQGYIKDLIRKDIQNKE